MPTTLKPAYLNAPDAELERLRTQAISIGLPVDDIDEELMRRKSEKVRRANAPTVVQAESDYATSRAQNEALEVQRNTTRYRPEFIQREQDIDAQKAETAAGELRRREQRDITRKETELSELEWKNRKLQLDTEIRNAGADARKQQTAHQNKFNAYRTLMQEVMAQRRRLDDIQDARQKTIAALGNAIESSKPAIIKEQDELNTAYANLSAEVRGKEQVLQAFEQEFTGSGVMPTTQPGGDMPAPPQLAATQPAPATQPAQPATKLTVAMQRQIRTLKQRADSGDPAAIDKLNRIRRAAESGDPESAAALALIGG